MTQIVLPVGESVSFSAVVSKITTGQVTNFTCLGKPEAEQQAHKMYVPNNSKMLAHSSLPANTRTRKEAADVMR